MFEQTLREPALWSHFRQFLAFATKQRLYAWRLPIVGVRLAPSFTGETDALRNPPHMSVTIILSTDNIREASPAHRNVLSFTVPND